MLGGKSSLVDAYLTQLEAGLKALPKQRRQDELREARSHLLAALNTCLASGLPLDEAAKAALEQFGTVEVVQPRVVAAWEREKAGDRRDFGVVSLLLVLVATVLNRAFHDYHPWPNLPQTYVPGSAIASCIVFGAFLGWWYPRVAGKSVTFTWLVCLCLQDLIMFMVHHGKLVELPYVLDPSIQPIFWPNDMAREFIIMMSTSLGSTIFEELRRAEQRRLTAELQRGQL